MINMLQKYSGIPRIKGGLVLTPKTNLYSRFIVVIDFDSLYPSIIKRYKICFSTIQRNFIDLNDFKQLVSIPERDQDERTYDPKPLKTLSTEDEDTDYFDRIHSKQIVNLSGKLKEIDLEYPVLSQVSSDLIKKRKLIKKQLQAMKTQSKQNPEKVRRFETMQKAYKLLANSVYGCLGFSNSRFYSPVIADTITGIGRHILRKSKEELENKGFEVIYGDTDSLMVDTKEKDIKKVITKSQEITNIVNALFCEKDKDLPEDIIGYKNISKNDDNDISEIKQHKIKSFDSKEKYQNQTIKVDLDAIYKTMLMVSKKKYIGLRLKSKLDQVSQRTEEYNLEIKGVQIIRKDSCHLVKDILQKCINVLIYSPENIKHFVNLLKNYKTALEKFSEKFNYKKTLLNIDLDSIQHRSIEIIHTTQNFEKIPDFTPETIKIEMGSFIMKSTLKRRIETYSKKQMQPHVRVAKYLINREGKSIEDLLNQQIPFIISEDLSNSKDYHEKALHPREILLYKENIDFQWYIQKKIIPNIYKTFESVKSVTWRYCLKYLISTIMWINKNKRKIY